MYPNRSPELRDHRSSYIVANSQWPVAVHATGRGKLRHTDIAFNPAFHMECGRRARTSPRRCRLSPPYFLIHSLPATIWDSGIGPNLIRFLSERSNWPETHMYLLLLHRNQLIGWRHNVYNLGREIFFSEINPSKERSDYKKRMFIRKHKCVFAKCSKFDKVYMNLIIASNVSIATSRRILRYVERSKQVLNSPSWKCHRSLKISTNYSTDNTVFVRITQYSPHQNDNINKRRSHKSESRSVSNSAPFSCSKCTASRENAQTRGGVVECHKRSVTVVRDLQCECG